MSRKKNSADVNNGRDDSGRFAQGNKLAPGNPFHRRMAEMRQAMLDAVSPQDVQDVIRQVVVKARLGDLTAAKLVLGYVVGKPVAAIEPDRVDIDEWQLHTERPALSQVQRAMAGSIRPDVANLTVRATDLHVGETLYQNIRALKPGTAPTDGALSAGGKHEHKPSGGRKSSERKAPVESSEVSILGGGGKSKTPLSDSGYTGHFCDRIAEEGQSRSQTAR